MKSKEHESQQTLLFILVILILAAMTYARGVLAAEPLPVPPGVANMPASVQQGVSTQQDAPAALPQPRRSGSLYKASIASRQLPTNGKAPQAAFTYVPEPEPKRLKKHDLVTIVVREESEAKSDSKSEASKSDALDAKIDSMLKLMSSKPFVSGGGISDIPPEIKLGGNRDFSAEGSFERSDSFTSRITAEVVDVKPNNTLVLQATKHIKTDDEQQTLVLSGICRVEDISPDNSVLSTQLHDLSVNKQTKGRVRDASKQGWFGRAFDFVNPF